jgi:hypothetical protein
LKKTSFVSCKDCHSKTNNPKKKPLLVTIDDFKSRLTDVASEILTDSMPPTDEGDYKSLNDCERAMLDAWVAAGTPTTTGVKVYDLEACRPIDIQPPVENPPTEPPPVVEPPEEPPPVENPTPVDEETITFALLQKTAFISCAECHSKTKNPQKKPLLTNLEQYQARLNDVQSEVNADDMPETDEGATLLTACEKAMMNKWIDLGAPSETGFKISDLQECKSPTIDNTTQSTSPAVQHLTLQQTLLNMLQKNEAVDSDFKLEDQLVTFDYLLTTSFVSCKECHSKTKNPKKKPLLTNMDEYIARLEDVKHAIQTDDMPKTSEGAALLTVCEKAMMNVWIDSGTPSETATKVLDIAECRAN